MRRRDLKRLADPTPTPDEILDEFDRVERMLRDIAHDQSVRTQWQRRRLLAWRNRLYAALPEPRRPSDPTRRPAPDLPPPKERRPRLLRRSASG